jgi:hypothetical protein
VIANQPEKEKTMTTLVAALRKRFPTKQKLLEALGVDQALLDEEIARLRKQLGHGPRLGLDAKGNRLPLRALDEEVLESARTPSASPNGSPAGNAAAQLRLAIENELAGFENLPEGLAAKIFKLLEQHAPLNGDEEPLGEREMQELRRREEHGPEALDAESFSEFLRGKGVHQETIEGALNVVKDAMPLNALHGGSLARGGGPGGIFAAKKRTAGAMDRALSSACKKAPGLRDIVIGGIADRGRRESTMSAAQQRRFEERFPDIARTY